MGEPPPWGESPPCGTDQNEIGFNLFKEWFHDNFLLEEIGDGIPQSPNFSLFDGIIEHSDSLNCSETVQSSNDSNFSDVPFGETSEHIDSIISNILDEINTIEFDEGQGVVCSNRNQYLNGVENNNTNTTTNLPLSTLQVNTQSSASLTGNDPVSQKVLHNDEILSAMYTGISNSPEVQQIPLISRPGTTVEVISDSNSVGNTSENGSVLLENSISNMELDESTEDNIHFHQSASGADTIMSGPLTSQQADQFNQSASGVGTPMPVFSQEADQFNQSASGVVTAMPCPLISQQADQFNQSASGVRTAMPVFSQEADQFNQSASGVGTAMPVFSQEADQFNQSASGVSTAMPVFSQEADQFNQSASGVSTAMPVFSQEADQFTQSASGVGTAMSVFSQEAGHFNQSASGASRTMTGVSYQSNHFMHPAIGTSTVLPGIMQHNGPSSVDLSTISDVAVICVLPICVPVSVQVSIPANTDSMRIPLDQVNNAPNLPYPDERTRNRQERGRIASKKHREKKKEEEKALKAKERDLSKQNVDLKEQVERLKTEIEEVKKKNPEEEKKKEDKE